MALSRTQIQTAFQNSLGRAASTSEENSYFSVSQSGALTDAQVFSTISNSREADLTADPVVRFYQAAFGRVPDQAGLDNASDYLHAFGATAATYQNLATMFAQTAEFTNRFGTGTQVDAAYVQALYSTILGRTASAAEVDGYVSGAAGYTTRGGVLYAISQSNEAISLSDTAVNGFLNNAAQGQAVYTGTLYTAQNGAPNGPGGGTVGTTTPLTTNIDALTGTGANDTFIGTNTTLNTGDSINGGAGTDTLRVIVGTGGNNFAALPSLSAVERIEVQSFDTTASTINLANSTGVTTVAVTTGSGAVEFSNASSLLAAEATNATGNLTIGYNASVVAGTTDTQTFTTSAAAIPTLSIGGIETLALTASSGASSIATITDTSLKAITVSGAGSVTLGGTTALATNTNGAFSLNASANSGGVTATFAAGAVTATGGSGNDKFAFGATFDTTDTVVGGAGTDTIAIDGINFTTAGANANQFALLNTKVSGVEVLELTGSAATTIDRSALTNTEITKILFNTTGAGATDTITNLTSATTVAVGTANVGALALTAAQGQQTVSLNVEGSATAASAGTGAVTLTNATTLNVASSGSAAADNGLGGITTASNSIINVTGSKSIDLGTLATAANNTAGNVGDTINGGSFTGKLSLVGTGANDVITVGSGGSVISGGTGSDTITLGSGTDRLNYTAGDSVAGANTTVTYDIVNGFAAGTDKFGVAVTSGATVAVQQGSAYTAAASGSLSGDITAAINAGSGNVGLAANGVAVVTITGAANEAGTYLVVNDGTPGTIGYTTADTVIKLAGLTGTLSAGDFINTTP